MHALAIAALHVALFYYTSDCWLSAQAKKNMTAIIPLERNNTKVIRIVGDAVQRFNKNWEKNLYYFRLDTVQSARKRYSPSATIYDINYTIRETDCERKTVKTAKVQKKCNEKRNGRKLYCNYTFHYQNKFLIFEQYDLPCSENATKKG